MAEINKIKKIKVGTDEYALQAQPFIVTAYENHTNPIEYGADKTSQEIYQAWVDDQIIICKYDMDGFTNIELQPVAIYPESAVFSNSAIIPNGLDSINQYFCLVISGNYVQKFDTSLATEAYVNAKVTAITNEEIDAICGGAIYAASEVEV